jgi:hypothetical protein
LSSQEFLFSNSSPVFLIHLWKKTHFFLIYLWMKKKKLLLKCLWKQTFYKFSTDSRKNLQCNLIIFYIVCGSFFYHKLLIVK